MGLFGGFKKLLRGVTKPISQVAKAIPGGDIILPAAATLVAGPAAGAAVSGANTFGKTGSLGAGLGAGLAGYGLGAAGSALGASGSGIAGLSGSQVGNAVGSYIGSNAGAGLGQAIDPTRGNNPAGAKIQSTLPSGPRPKFLKNTGIGGLGEAFGGLDPLQVRTRIATKDLYAGGADTAEQDYLARETNNRLLQEGSDYDLTPVEEQFFQRQGYGFSPGNKASLLEAFARRYA